MTVEVRPSKNYPGRTDLAHKTYAESNTTTIISLTPEDVATLRELLNHPATEPERPQP